MVLILIFFAIFVNPLSQCQMKRQKHDQIGTQYTVSLNVLLHTTADSAHNLLHNTEDCNDTTSALCKKPKKKMSQWLCPSLTRTTQ